jgi:hypothetical protein
LAGHVEYRIASTFWCHADDLLTGLHNLAGLRRGRNYHAASVRPQFGIAHTILSNASLCFGGF